MRISNLAFVRYGLLAIAVVLLLIGSAVSGCSKPVPDYDLSDYSVTEDFKEFKWPTSGLATMLPTPESNYGEISTESSTSLFVYVGDTSKQQYDAYVEACQEKGFSVDYSKGADYFHASNTGGYRLSLSYDDEESYMTISLKQQENTSSSASSSSSSSASVAEPAEQSADSSDTPVNGIRPSFKEAMDSYEEFFNQYRDFMEKYNANPSSPTMIAEYAKFMAQYNETMNKLDAMGEEDMSDQELQYYTEVTSRINQRLAEVAAA